MEKAFLHYAKLPLSSPLFNNATRHRHAASPAFVELILTVTNIATCILHYDTRYDTYTLAIAMSRLENSLYVNRVTNAIYRVCIAVVEIFYLLLNGFIT